MKEKILKRILVFLVLVMLLTGIVFGAFNRPTQVKAELVGGLALGVGALTAILGSYFAASGLDLSFNDASESDVSQWFNDVAQSHGAVENGYFDQYGNLVDDSAASLILGGVGGNSFWVFSKTFASWLDGIKSDIVSENNISVNSSSIIDSYTNVVVGNERFPLFSSSSAVTSSFVYPDLPKSIFDITASGTQYFKISNDSAIEYTHPYNGNSNQFALRIGYFQNNSFINSSGYDSGSFSSVDGVVLGCAVLYGSGSAYQLGIFTYEARTPAFIPLLPRKGVSIRNPQDVIVRDTTIEGSLTDGYADFENALNQDLSNEAENDDAVVVTGVGDLDGALTGLAGIENIIDKIIAGELDGTYDGVYEDQETAEEELDNNEVVVPEWKPGFVIVNGLEDFFPFCIPFDLYEIIRLLNVPAEAPRITWTMGFANKFESQDVVLDFSQWDPAARIFRILVVIGFLIFLTIKTRDLIRG